MTYNHLSIEERELIAIYTYRVKHKHVTDEGAKNVDHTSYLKISTFTGRPNKSPPVLSWKVTRFR